MSEDRGRIDRFGALAFPGRSVVELSGLVLFSLK
jgi:hypothetical protein